MQLAPTLAPSILMKRRADLTQLRQPQQQPRSNTGTTFVRFPPQYTFYILTGATLQADLLEREKIVIETAKLAASSRSSILCIEPNLHIALLCSLSFVISYLEQQIKKHYLNPQPWLQNQRNIIVYL